MYKNSSFPTSFAEKIISWYEKNKRDLPWRNTTDAYRIWLSEVMLQQTRVAQGLPYYEKFVAAYPTVHDLAVASEQEVLRLWQGLGYYSRARNMHKTAQQVVEKHGGVFPTTYAGLVQLQGIGPYTAAAIASFAFNEVVPVVDGNVYRVLARVLGIEQDIGSSAARKIFTAAAQQLIDPAKPATFNQAIMEFGALQCTPTQPNCMFCPLQTDCYAFQHQLQQVLPIKEKKVKVRQRYFQYLVIVHQERYYMKRRGSNDVWEGLYDFYLVETAESTDNVDDFLSDFLVENAACLERIAAVKTMKHVLTHQVIFAQFWLLKWKDDCATPLPDLQAFTLAEIAELPKPILINSFIETHLI